MTGNLVRLLDRLARGVRVLRDDQGGQSLIVVALSMTVALGVSALAIDAAVWYQKHHQTQVAYDAASLAAANCLANPNVGPNTSSMPNCTSTTDTAHATTDAVTMAKKNGITIQPSDVVIDTTADTVRIRQKQSAPALFAAIFGIHSASVTAGSTASWKTSGVAPCGTDKTSCSAIYAANKSCAEGEGLQFGTASQGGASLSVTGMIHSEGEMTFQNSTVGANGLTVSGSCYSGGDMPSNDGNTATQVASEGWPVDYSKSPYYSPCSGSSCTTVSGIANVPSYCTQATTSSSGFIFYQNNGVYVLPQDGNVYCSIGTGNPSDPSTWNGPINFQTSIPQRANSQCKTYTDATYIGGNIISQNPYGGGFVMCLAPANPTGSNHCLMYSNGTVELYNGTFGWEGDVFDPGGTIQLGSAGSGGGSFTSPSGMLEGINVTDPNIQMTLVGDGPVESGGGGGNTSGTDSLTN